MIKSRIAILDGFRALAILSVMLFHFFVRWAPPLNEISLYPYKNSYKFFDLGYLGVQFFFIISGFVIFFTLDTTTQFNSFWKKRLIRLLPSMAIASLITFTIFILFDFSFLFPSSHRAYNFIPSITFIRPELFNRFGVSFNYINGSYWSLWPEIQFYLFSSIIYYINKDKFIRNYLFISILLIIVNYIFQNIQGSNKLNLDLPANILIGYSNWIQGGFNLITFLPFFSIGVLFYLLFKNRQCDNKTSLFVKLYLSIFLIYILYSGIHLPVRIVYLIMFLLFFCFIYFPDKLKIFEKKGLTNIGESSYFLYLIHENIGILMIYSIGKYFSPFSFVFTFLVIIVLIIFSNIYTIKIDKKINKWLKFMIIKH